MGMIVSQKLRRFRQNVMGKPPQRKGKAAPTKTGKLSGEAG